MYRKNLIFARKRDHLTLLKLFEFYTYMWEIYFIHFPSLNTSITMKKKKKKIT